MTVYNPDGGEFLVNTTTLGEQSDPAITSLADGGYIVTWASMGQDGSGWGVYAQRYTADGSKLGSDFRVNTTTAGDQNAPAISGLSDGGFVASWMSYDPSGISGIYVQRYAVDGTVMGSETQVNTTSGWDQRNPAVTELADGGYIVTWQSFQPDGSGYNVYARLYDQTGSAIGNDFLVNTATERDQVAPEISALADGGFIVSWTTYDRYGSAEFHVQRYDLAGIAIGDETNLSGVGYFHPEMAGLADGGYVIVWVSFGYDASANGYSIMAQRFAADGSALGDTFIVNNTGATWQSVPGVAALDDGGFVVAWQAESQDGSPSEVYARAYDANGNSTGNEILISTTLPEGPSYPVITGLSEGGFVVAWQTDGQDSSATGIYAQVFSAASNSAPVLAPDLQVVKVETYVDATEFGLSSTEAVTFRVEYSLDLVPGSGAYGTTDIVESYGGATLVVSMAGEQITLPVSIMLADDNAIGDVFWVQFFRSAGDPVPTFLGYDLEVMRVQIGDTSMLALEAFALPPADNLVDAFDYIQSIIRVSDPDTGMSFTARHVEFSSSLPTEPTFQVISSSLPVIADQSFDEDTAVSFSLPEGAFSDPDGDALTFSATLADGADLPGWLSFDPVSLTFSGTPPLNFNGSFEIEVTASDGEFETGDQFTLTIDPVNDAPQLLFNQVIFTIAEDSPGILFNLGFFDVDDDALQFSINMTDGSPVPDWLTYSPAYRETWHDYIVGFWITPPSDWNGDVIFELTASDGTFTVSDIAGVRVILVNDLPIAQHSFESASEDGTIVTGQLVATDADDGAVLTFTLDAPIAGLTVNPDGSWSFDPSDQAYQHIAQGAVEQIVAGYTVTDEFGASDNATLSIDITGVNDAPVIEGNTSSDGFTAVSQVWSNNAPQTTEQDVVIEALPNGGYVIAWIDGNGGQNNIMVQIFGAGGEAIGEPFAANDPTPAGEYDVKLHPDIEVLDNGTFVVAWDQTYEGYNGNGNGVLGRVFDFDGTALGNEFKLGQYTSGFTQSREPQIVDAGDGNFWSIGVTQPGGANFQGLFAFKMASDGTVLSGPVTVDIPPDNNPLFQEADLYPGAMLLANGNIVVAWQFFPGGGVSEIRFRVFDSEFNPVSPIETAATGFSTSAAQIRIAPTEDGGFVMNWEAYVANDGAVIYTQIYDNDYAQTGSTSIFPGNVNGFSGSSVGVLPDGTVVVAWSFEEQGVSLQKISPSGELLGERYDVSEIQGGIDGEIAVLADGNIALAYRGADVISQVFAVGNGTVSELIEVVEDAAVVAGQLLATDVDDGAILTFALDAPVAGLAVIPDGSWSFDPSDQAYQHLAQGEIEQVIANYTVTDEFGGSDSATLLIEVSGVNDAPVIDAPEGIIPVGGEFLVNTQSIHNQRDPAVGELVGGGYVIAWYDAQTSSIKAQIYDTERNSVGNEFKVSTSSSAGEPAVAGLADGTFVITWHDFETSRSYDIKAQHFDAAGAKLGSEFQVNTVATSAQEFPFIAALDDGGFIICWRDSSGTLGDASDWSIKAQIFDETVNAFGSEFLVNTTTAGGQAQGVAAALGNGNFVALWSDQGKGIKGQIFANDGTKIGGEFSVSGSGTARPSVALLTDGNFVVAWTDSFGGLGDNSGASVNYRIFDASGDPLGPELLGNDQIAGSQVEAVVSATSNGGFVISWTDTNVAAGDGSATSIKAKAFDAVGAALGEEFLVNSQTTGDQIDPVLAPVGNGFVIVWETSDATQDGDRFAVKAQQFDIAANPFVGIKVTEDVPSQAYSISAIDVDGDELSYAVKPGSEPALGQVQFDQVAGTFVYTPNANANGEDSFTIVVSDEHGGTVESVVSVTVTPENDVPIANTGEATLNEDGLPALINSDFEDVDLDDTHTFAVDTTGTIGLVTNFGNGTFGYDPNEQFEWLAAGESATDSFVYIVDDGMGGVDTALVTLTINGQNDLPYVYAGEGQTTEITISDTGAVDSSKTILSYFDYFDPDLSDNHTGSAVRVSTSATSALGTFGGAANSIPAGSLIGQGLLVYSIAGDALNSLAYGETVTEVGRLYVLDDSTGQYSLATAGQIDLTVTLIGANDAPVASSTQVELREDDAPLQGQLLASDVDNGAILTFALDAAVAGLTVKVDGSWEFDAMDWAYQFLSEGESLPIEANFIVTDEWGATDTATLLIEMTGTNDTPIAVDDMTSVDEDGMVTGNVISGVTTPAEIADNAADSDVDHLDTLSVVEVNGLLVGSSIAGTYGSLVLNADGSYSYSADNDILDTMTPGTPGIMDVFSYTLSDNHGATSTANLTIAITILDDGTTIIGDASPFIEGGDGDDLIDSGSGNDTVLGGGGTDMLFGDKGSDELHGGDGIDFLSGGAGNDSLYGDAGDDIIFGGKGSDLMAGGEGADIFAFIDEGRSRAGDTISDFEFGIDQIYLGDGLSVSRMRETAGSTEITLSDGQQILLQGVTGVLGMESDIFTSYLSGWSATLPIV